MILVFGTICLDRIHMVPHLPKAGGYVEITRSEQHLGGEALNTTTALIKWGAQVRLAGNPLGSSHEANWLKEQIAASGLPAPEIPEADVALPCCDLYVTPDGQRTMFGTAFTEAEAKANPENVNLNGVDILTVDGVPLTASLALIKRAQANKIQTYVMDVPDSVELTISDFWQTSTASIGTPGHIQKNVILLNQIIKKTNCFSILSDGANGFVAGSPQQTVRHYSPFPAESVVDSTGAGDSFRAGMLFGLSKKWPLAQCLQFASATGSINCRAIGAVAGLPTKEEVFQLISEHPEIARSYE